MQDQTLLKADLEPGWHQANVVLVNDAQPMIYEEFMVSSYPDSSELIIKITVLATEGPTAGTLEVLALDTIIEDNEIPAYKFGFSDTLARKRQRVNAQVIEDTILAYCVTSLAGTSAHSSQYL
ncbi:hypothetical protein N7451_012093 [Penicillium sp. IBT 35674x]|nr:hypothetical protein N7451_012093 [Penicillium sp. IBT 35674x]